MQLTGIIIQLRIQKPVWIPTVVGLLSSRSMLLDCLTIILLIFTLIHKCKQFQVRLSPVFEVSIYLIRKYHMVQQVNSLHGERELYRPVFPD